MERKPTYCGADGRVRLPESQRRTRLTHASAHKYLQAFLSQTAKGDGDLSGAKSDGAVWTEPRVMRSHSGTGLLQVILAAEPLVLIEEWESRRSQAVRPVLCRAVR